MRLYNVINGVNPAAPLVLMYLNKTPQALSRFRDAYFKRDEESKEIRMIVLTRCGGSNREEYGWVMEAMKTNPLFIREYDDDFDNTYNYMEFQLPQHLKELEGEFTDNMLEQRSIKQKTDDFIASLNSSTK